MIVGKTLPVRTGADLSFLSVPISPLLFINPITTDTALALCDVFEPGTGVGM